jgi:EAL domain-containing protein (putative c-di-GMP-specific phosphodiesterase class I)
VIGAEALCRWIRDGQVVPPIDFIPVLERSKMVCDLDFYVLDHACRDIRNWIDKGGSPVEISTNFSRVHLNNPYLSKQIVQTIDRYEIPHELIIVELTETTSSVHSKRMSELVYKLKDEGIRTSVDDFGVGYSSMSMLRDIPFSELKIDRSFLTYTTDTRDRSAVMMKHVISMATELGMRCIAEGVETPDQIRMLKEMDCLRAQGFYFDRPLPREEFVKRLRMKVYSEKPVQ